MLDCGYTSAFSAAAPKPRLDVVMRREIEAGREAGPRLLANGRDAAEPVANIFHKGVTRDGV